MHVTFCAYDGLNYVGGPNAWLRRLLPALRDRGLSPRALFFLTAPPEQCETLQALRRQGIVCAYRSLPAYTEQRVRWLLRQLAGAPPDVFVPNLMIPAYYAAALVRAAGIPTVGILHSDDAFHHGLLQEFVLGDPAYRLAALVCVSRFLEQMVYAHEPPETQVFRLPYGAPMPARSAPAPDGVFRLAYVGRLVEEQKQISEVARALCRAIRAIPSAEALIYGEGPARPAVERILREEGVGLPIRLVGKIDSDRIQQELLACHALVLLSDYEGLPIALMEGMACGLAPICLRARSGVTELVEHGANGLLVEDRGDSFLAAVKRLVAEPGVWERLSRAARATIAAEYSEEAATAGWERMLRELRPARTTPIHMPRRFDLPPIRPALAREDRRRPPLQVRVLELGRRIVRRTLNKGGSLRGPPLIK